MPLRAIHHHEEAFFLPGQKREQKASKGLEVESKLRHETLDAAVVGVVFDARVQRQRELFAVGGGQLQSEPTRAGHKLQARSVPRGSRSERTLVNSLA